MKANQSSNFSIFTYLIIAIIVLVAYFPSLQNDYGFNDNYIFNNVTEQGISASYEILTSPYRQVENQSYGYRPIVSLSVALEVSLFGKNPTISHGINILLYLFICWLLFYLAKMLYPKVDDKGWLLGVLCFAVLSIHTDVVCSIKSRDELLVCLFALKGFVFAKRYLSQSRWYFLPLISICFLLAAWSKPTDILYILFGLMILLVAQKSSFKNIGITGLAMISGSFIARIIKRLVVVSSSRDLPFIQFPLQDTNLVDRIPTAIYSVGKYIELLFMPQNLSFYYGYNQVPISFSEAQQYPTFYFGLISILILGGLLWYFYQKNKIVFLGISILCIGLVLFSNLLKPGPGLIAERFFFGPSISILFLVGGLYAHFFNRIDKKQNIYYYIFFIFIILFSAFQFQKTFKRNFDWKDKLTLFKADINHLQNSSKANLLLADEMMYENRKSNAKTHSFDKIELYYERAVKVYPNYPIAWNNYAYACLFFGKNERAKKMIDKALALERSPEMLSNLASYFKQTNIVEKELAVWKEIVHYEKAREELLAQGYLRIHDILIQQNKFSEAEEYARVSLKIFPKKSSYYDHLAKACFGQQKYEESFLAWKNAYNLNPESTIMPYKLWKAYESIGELDSASVYKRFFEENQ